MISPDFNSSTAVYVSICRKSNRDLSRLVIPEIFYLSIHRKSNCGSSRLVIPEILLLDLLEVKSRFKRRSPDTGNLDYNS